MSWTGFVVTLVFGWIATRLWIASIVLAAAGIVLTYRYYRGVRATQDAASLHQVP